MRALFGRLVPVTLVLAACQTVNPNASINPGDGTSDVQFLESGWSVNQCGVRYAHAPKIKLCIQGNGDVNVAKTKAKAAVEAWLAPLQQQFQNIASGVEFTCTGQHINVNLSFGAIASMGGPGFVQVGDANELGTWMHEFGHAFACLGDTYVNGQAGYCYQGQPQSVMCYGLLLNNITADDRAGVIHQYNKLGFNAAPLDPQGDEDGDGVANGQDHCLGTAAGAPIWHEQNNGQWRGCAYGQTPSLL